VIAPAPVAALAEPGAEEPEAEVDEVDTPEVDAVAGAPAARRGVPTVGRRKGRGEAATE
jgi:hypothetical protein